MLQWLVLGSGQPLIGATKLLGCYVQQRLGNQPEWRLVPYSLRQGSHVFYDQSFFQTSKQYVLVLVASLGHGLVTEQRITGEGAIRQRQVQKSTMVL